MNSGVRNAKERLRNAAAYQRSKQPIPQLDIAKARLRLTASCFDQAGDEAVRHLGIAELTGWVKKDPWRALFIAATGGFLAGKLKESEVILIGLMLRLFDLISAENPKPPRNN
ncbi:MAG: hypothetical protein ACU83N_12545 [Gammaproteobacteria bacterium]